MLDYQQQVAEQMANHQPNSLAPSSYHHGHQSLPQSTESNYFYPDTSSSRQPFALNAAPLAALHGMADIKVPQAVSSPAALSGYNSAAYHSMKNSMLNATPHGISDILNRSDLHALQARLGQGMYYNSCSQAAPTPGGLSPTNKDVSASRSLYHWPNNSQIMPPTQSPVWNSKHGGMISVEGKDGKKKNTRPTFSGSQIFALEKTFEQQKYLAGPERGRLAYALGMSESQVKVWFQNRRTKWRKRHAADMATTKRRADNPVNDNTQAFEHSNNESHHRENPSYQPENSDSNHMSRNELRI